MTQVTKDIMRHVVGVGDMIVSNNTRDKITTHSLGSCVGITIYDPIACVGGMLHFQLPLSKNSPERAKENPYMFADTGIPALFKKACEAGAEMKRLIVKAAGGAKVMDKNNFFNIGSRNILVMKKLFWKNGILIEADDLGGDHWRTMKLDISGGSVLIKNSSHEFQL